jgi:hypothetical protein
LTVLPAKTKWLPSLDFNEDDLAKMSDKEINKLVIKLEREQKIAGKKLFSLLEINYHFFIP